MAPLSDEKLQMINALEGVVTLHGSSQSTALMRILLPTLHHPRRLLEVMEMDGWPSSRTRFRGLVRGIADCVEAIAAGNSGAAAQGAENALSWIPEQDDDDDD